MFRENVLYRTKCVRIAVLFCENVLGGTKKRLSIPSSPTVSLDIPRILHLLQNICGFQPNSLVGYPRPRLGIVLRARLSEKSNIPQRESGIRFRPLHGQNLPIHAFVRKYPPFSGQNVLGFCYRSDIRVTMAQRKIGANIALFLHRLANMMKRCKIRLFFSPFSKYIANRQKQYYAY